MLPSLVQRQVVPLYAVLLVSASVFVTQVLPAVVEGVGDHGCEYMTGGKAVISRLNGS